MQDVCKLEKPPNWETLEKHFGVKWGRVVVTYAPHVYSAKPLRPDVEAHEKIHLEQQGRNPKKWWERYLKDIEFRLTQEVVAYRRQYEFVKSITEDRQFRFKVLAQLAIDLSSSMYGNIVNFHDALNLIKER